MYIFKEVENIIKALIVTRKGGMPMNELNNEYLDVENDNIPFKELGFHSLESFLRKIKGINYGQNIYGKTILTVNDEKINHLNQLIENQKPAKTKRRSKKHKRNPNRSFRNREYFNASNDRHDFSFTGSSGYKSSSSFSDEEEKPLIFIDSRRKSNYVYEPMYNRRQLIGDDFFLQLAIKELRVPIWRKAEKTALYSGLCASGQTIRQCSKKLENLDMIGEKVTILLGAEDVYEGRSLEQMKADYLELLDLLEYKFDIPRNSVTICTIPPLANLSFRIDFEKCSTLQMFNNWLRSLVRDYYEFDCNGVYWAYDLADFDTFLRTDVGGIKYSYFQNDARYVSGTRQPYVLFNGRGRKLVLDLI